MRLAQSFKLFALFANSVLLMWAFIQLHSVALMLYAKKGGIEIRGFFFFFWGGILSLVQVVESGLLLPILLLRFSLKSLWLPLLVSHTVF